MNTRKQLVQKLDRLYKEWMKKNLPYKCVTCKYWRRPTAKENLQWGHYITATKAGTRWDRANVHWQCPACNLQHEYNAAPYAQFIIDTYGVEGHAALVKRSWSREGKPYSITELREMIDAYENGTR